MSRIGKKKINLPSDVTAQITGPELKVKGKLGELAMVIDRFLDVRIDQNAIVSDARGVHENGARWGTFQSRARNLVTGVSEGYSKKLEVQGVGFRAAMKGKALAVEVGFSHPLEVDVPAGLTVKVEKNIITISGIDKHQVGQYAAKIRDLKRPEPYKGKGIRYQGEEVRHKEGKKAGATETK